MLPSNFGKEYALGGKKGQKNDTMGNSGEFGYRSRYFPGDISVGCISAGGISSTFLSSSFLLGKVSSRLTSLLNLALVFSFSCSSMKSSTVPSSSTNFDTSSSILFLHKAALVALYCVVLSFVSLIGRKIYCHSRSLF